MNRNTRPRGLTRDAGWQIGVRRTLPLPADSIWELLLAPEGRRCWLGETAGLAIVPGATYQLSDGTAGTFTVVEPGSHIRFTWQPPGWSRPSIVQARVIRQGARSVLAFHQEHLPDEEARQLRRAFFASALDQLVQLSAN